MRILYFDCFSGISGDMALGALLDLGIDVETWKKELDKLSLDKFEVRTTKRRKGILEGTDVEVISHDSTTHRNLSRILEILEKSSLPPSVKQLSQKMFLKLGEAESRVHGIPLSEVHFHEIGAIDTIIDIVGTAIALELLKIDLVYSSPLPLGEGFIEFSHGTIPVPAPATLELLKGIPVYSQGVKGELVTPTGAVIVSTLAKDFGPLPLLKIEKVGYGVGKHDYGPLNWLRVFLGETCFEFEEDKNVVVEANIDDMNPQVYEYLQEKLFQKGALDVTMTPIIMKKSRPGILLSVLARPEREREIIDVIFRESTSIGVRTYQVEKRMAKREIQEIESPWGKVRVKVSRYQEMVQITPEYEDCKRIAQREGIPLKAVIREIERLSQEIFPESNFE
jgi:uncharacterized protein (TIGR00299 family) protein